MLTVANVTKNSYSFLFIPFPIQKNYHFPTKVKCSNNKMRLVCCTMFSLPVIHWNWCSLPFFKSLNEVHVLKCFFSSTCLHPCASSDFNTLLILSVTVKLLICLLYIFRIDKNCIQLNEGTNISVRDCIEQIGAFLILTLSVCSKGNGSL